MQKFKMPRQCAVCNQALNPFSKYTFTAHEFKCYKAHPDKIPEEHKEVFAHELLREKRS